MATEKDSGSLTIEQTGRIILVILLTIFAIAWIIDYKRSGGSVGTLLENPLPTKSGRPRDAVEYKEISVNAWAEFTTDETRETFNLDLTDLNLDWVVVVNNDFTNPITICPHDKKVQSLGNGIKTLNVQLAEGQGVHAATAIFKRFPKIRRNDS